MVRVAGTLECTVGQSTGLYRHYYGLEGTDIVV